MESKTHLSSINIIYLTLQIDQQILRFLKNYSFEPKLINRLIVSAFLIINNIKLVKNQIIKNLIIQEEGSENDSLKEFVKQFNSNGQNFSLEELNELFEFVISPADKEVNGAVYTPKYIRDFIVTETINIFSENPKSLLEIKFGDIACGCGSFLLTFVNIIKMRTNKSYFDIYKENIYGLDIQLYSIERTKILLSLLAIINGEDAEIFDFNLYQGNALKFDWNSVSRINSNNGFDIIVGNPPYVGAAKIDNESRKLLSNWSVSKVGKPDLYIPFFQIGIELLNSKGVLGLITMNSFCRSLNGIGVRNYFQENEFHFKLIDFGANQVFKGRRTYTCICIIRKERSKGILYYKISPSKLSLVTEHNYNLVQYSNLDYKKGWILERNNIYNNIKKIESTGMSLEKTVSIKNGIATLRNSIYVFKPTSEDDEFYEIQKNGETFKIEKSICRNIIRPSTLKFEGQIDGSLEKVIFPYISEKQIQNSLFNRDYGSIKIVPINETYFRNKFPKAYSYLLKHKNELLKRDKGNRTYEYWYLFGRSQGLTLQGFKLLFPYITDKPYFVYTNDKDLLYYNGFALFSNNSLKLKVVQKILCSQIFWYYVKHVSRPYENGYFSMGKRYIKNFGICNLTNEEENWLIKQTDIEIINKFLCNKYDIPIELLESVHLDIPEHTDPT